MKFVFSGFFCEDFNFYASLHCHRWSEDLSLPCDSNSVLCTVQDGEEEAAAVMAKFGLGGGEEGSGEKFEGEFKWDGFQQVNDITEQNQALMNQLDEKDAEIDRLRDVILATEPMPGLDPERLLDIRVGTDVIDQVCNVDHSSVV